MTSWTEEEKKHVIKIGQKQYLLQENEGGYTLYTKAEWDAECHADHEVSEAGEIMFQGKKTGAHLTRAQMRQARP